ncbi:hypothetical protein TNCV_1760781 [Trichonephila clavipes]|nr:hypothetical protein TNCV_1760781 [Trichonephila clavipes]
MEAIASKAASGTSSAQAAKKIGLTSSVHNIPILQLYPYKLQSCHELLPADKNLHLQKMEHQDPHLLCHNYAGDFNNHNCI